MTSITRRKFLGSTAAVVGGVAASSSLSLPALAAGGTIKVGAVLPFSGGLELYGNQARLGLELAVSEINGSGGILGEKIEVLYEDNKTDPKTSVERATSLIRRDEVLALTGPITSNARDAMAPTIERMKTPLLYATNYEGGACSREVFCFNTVPNQELEKLVPALKQQAGDSFYMFGADYVWPQKMFETAKSLVESEGGSVAGVEFTPWGVKEFAPVIRRIKESGAKVLLFALPGADGITFIKQAEDLGLLEDVTVGFLGFAETYLGAFGEGKAQNMWVAVPFAESLQTPGAQEFVQKIRAQAGSDVPVSHYVMTHYNALMAVKGALEKAGAIDKDGLIDAMQGLSISTPTGPAEIGAADHHVTMNMYLAKTEGAGLSVVEDLGSIVPEAGCS